MRSAFCFRILILALVGWTLFPFAAMAASFCTSVQVKNACIDLSEAQRAVADQCDREMKQAGCEEFAKSHPKVVQEFKLRNCEVIASCPTQNKMGEYAKACAVNMVGAWKDMAVAMARFIAGDIKAPPELIDREEFFLSCTSADCKRLMLGPYVDMFKPEEIEGNPAKPGMDPRDPVNQNYLQGYSSKILYNKLLAKLRAQNKKTGMNEPFIEPWSGKKLDKLPKSPNERIDELLEKMGVKNTTCYDPAVLAEMRCYAFFAVIDPLLLTAASVKVLRLAGYGSRAEKVGRTLARAEGEALIPEARAIADNVAEAGAEATAAAPRAAAVKIPDTHRPPDGFSLKHSGKEREANEAALVKPRPASRAEVERYINSPEFRDGTYVVTIVREADGSDHMLYTPRLSGEGNSEFASHRSMNAAYKAEHGRDPVVVAAGECRISVQGVIIVCTNQSGTYMNGNFNADYITDAMEAHGFRRDKHSETRPFSSTKSADAHMKGRESALGEAMLKEKAPQLASELRELNIDLLTKLPADNPNRFDLKQLRSFSRNPALPPEIKDAYRQLQMTLGMMADGSSDAATRLYQAWGAQAQERLKFFEETVIPRLRSEIDAAAKKP